MMLQKKNIDCRFMSPYEETLIHLHTQNNRNLKKKSVFKCCQIEYEYNNNNKILKIILLYRLFYSTNKNLLNKIKIYSKKKEEKLWETIRLIY